MPVIREICLMYAPYSHKHYSYFIDTTKVRLLFHITKFSQKKVDHSEPSPISPGNVNHFRIALCILFFVFLEKNILLYKSFVLYKVLRYQEKHYNDTFQDTIEREHYS